MNSTRKISLASGIIYLLTFISVPTLSLYGPIHDADYIVGSGPDTAAIIGGILETIVGLGCIGSAVALYPVLKKQNEAMAMGLVGARVLEAATIFTGVAVLHTIVTLRQEGMGPDAVVTGHMLAVFYDRIFLIGQSFMPAVDDLLLGLLLYQSRLVPRALAMIGIVGAFVLVAGDVLVWFDILEQRAPSTALFAMPVALFEFSLGLLLVVKGFRPSAITESA